MGVLGLRWLRDGSYDATQLYIFFFPQRKLEIWHSAEYIDPTVFPNPDETHLSIFRLSGGWASICCPFALRVLPILRIACHWALYSELAYGAIIYICELLFKDSP
jgi:hypothetical protein